MHFCHEELAAFLTAFPFLGVAVIKLRAWAHARRANKCHPKHENG